MKPQQPDSRKAQCTTVAQSVRPRRGFSMAELMVVIAIIVVLASLLVSAVSRVRQAANSAKCLANLHNLSVAFHSYASDNDLHYPDPASTDTSWESMLQPYLNQSLVFACPSDLEVFPATGSSYDWRDTRDPATTLAGRRLSDATRAEAVLSFETLPGWHAKHLMNAVLVNGSCLTMDDDSCLGDLRLPIVAGPDRTRGR